MRQIARQIRKLLKPEPPPSPAPAKYVLESTGHCPACDQPATFTSRDAWLRDYYFCSNCRSIPRERAVMHVIETLRPDWKNLVMHESSPGDRGTSLRLAKECDNYVASQFFLDGVRGEVRNGVRHEDLRSLTFDDNSIDIHVSQDVLEHVFEPNLVFAEINRTLRPGGVHVCTVPLVRKHQPTQIRASLTNGEVVNHLPPDYHGNPVSADGSLVVTE